MKEQLFAELAETVHTFDRERAEKLALESIAAGIDPLETLEALTKAIREIGDLYDSGEVFLPELIAASEVTSAASAPLEAEIERCNMKKQSMGRVVIGTVFGDIHDIGKNMVATLLRASGFDVYDCGTNVKSDLFIERIRREQADLLALSALLTTTAEEQRRTISALKEQGLRDTVGIMVGGGGITKKFADDIGSDGYAATASGAAALAKKLLGLAD